MMDDVDTEFFMFGATDSTIDGTSLKPAILP